jgi:DNA-binding transcriptional regulator YdaS (Cro superfamily)
VPNMTPAQEAAYALDFSVSRDELRPEVQAEYDRLLEVRREAAHALKSRVSRDELRPEAQAEYDRLLEVRRVRPPASGSGMTVGAQGTVTIWQGGDMFLTADGHGVTVHERRVAAWAEISRFEDGGGWSSEVGLYWTLVAVLRTGKRVGVAGSGWPASPDTVAAVNRVAERHGIPAGVTGVPMENGKPVVLPGFWTRLLKGLLSSP